ncbi:MAG: hypothetical protein L0Y39_08930 [Methylococcaceae bacterium]|nr:hypothetical protein [Methylococcaceae bacterium]MCI0667928.1 hypothetical protein [Methylococcaceae bacterium]
MVVKFSCSPLLLLSGSGQITRIATRPSRLLRAIRQSAYDRVPLGGGRRLVNPQAGLAFDLEGPDAASTFIPPGTRIRERLARR